LVLPVFVILCLCAEALARPERITVAGGDSFTPLTFLNSDGKADGIHVALWNLWAGKTGVEADVQLMEWSQCIPALREGKVDAVDSVTYTPERAEFLDFTPSYGQLKTYIFFHESIGGVKGLDGLAGFPVGVVAGNVTEDYLRREAPKLRLIPYANYEEIVDAALKGRIRVFVGEEPTVPYYFARAGEWGGFRRSNTAIYTMDLRIAVRKGETELLKLIEQGMEAITPDERKAIDDEWAGIAPYTHVPWRWVVGVPAGLLVCVGLLFAWTAMLRRRIARATQTLRESEDRLRAFHEATFEGIVITEESQLIDANTAFTDLFGYELDELIGESVTKLVTPEDRDLVMSNIRSGYDKPYEHLALHKDGSIFNVEVCGKGVRYKGRQCRITAIRDVTERKRAEQAITESEERYRAIFDGAAEGILVMDVETKRFTYANPASCRMLGYSEEELRGIEIADIHPQEVSDHVFSEFKAQEPGEMSLARDVPFLRKDLTVISADVNTARVVIDSRQCNVGFLTDITERKEVQDQFIQAQKMEAIGRLAGGIAHDFRNQLTVIQGYAGMLESQSLVTEEGREYVREMIEAARRSTELTGQLLAFSRKQMLRPEILDLNVIVDNMAKALPRIIGEDIRLIVVPGENLGSVRVDQTQLQHAMMNLASNARDAMPTGGELVIQTANTELDEAFVKPHPGTRPGRYVVLSMSDKGIGMDADLLGRIFDPFFTTKGVGEGTGLGLSMVHGFVRQSGGLVTADSSPGEGTMFNIYLPRVDAEATPGVDTETRGELPRGTETVLLAEDEDAVRNIVTRVLRKNGYTVMETGNPAEALSLGERFDDAIDLLVTDVVMPGMDGVQLAERLKNIRPDLKVIFISGHADKLLAQHGMGGKLTDVILKPFSGAELCTKVRQVLDADQESARAKPTEETEKS